MGCCGIAEREAPLKVVCATSTSPKEAWMQVAPYKACCLCSREGFCTSNLGGQTSCPGQTSCLAGPQRSLEMVCMLGGEVRRMQP